MALYFGPAYTETFESIADMGATLTDVVHKVEDMQIKITIDVSGTYVFYCT